MNVHTMSVILFLSGLSVMLFIIIDLLVTVLAPQGAGPFTNRFSRTIWRIILKLAGKQARKNSLTYAGIFITYSTLITWVVIIWLANTVIFFSDPEALKFTNEEAYVTSFSDKMYYSGYVLSSMGNGDYTPTTHWWKFYTSFISFTGVVLISLGISYLIPILNAVTSKRRLAIRISSLGANPKEIIQHCESQEELKILINHVQDLEEDIITLAQQHLAYPIIHYYHSTKTFESLPIVIAALDELITILYHIDEQEDKYAEVAKIEGTRRAITYFLSCLKSAHIKPSDDQPEEPRIDYLDSLGLDKPVKELKNDLNRRKLLLAYLQNDGWEWSDMLHSEDSIHLEFE